MSTLEGCEYLVPDEKIKEILDYFGHSCRIYLNKNNYDEFTIRVEVPDPRTGITIFYYEQYLCYDDFIKEELNLNIESFKINAKEAIELHMSKGNEL